MGSELGIAWKFGNSDFGEISLNLFFKLFFGQSISGKMWRKTVRAFWFLKIFHIFHMESILSAESCFPGHFSSKKSIIGSDWDSGVQVLIFLADHPRVLSTALEPQRKVCINAENFALGSGNEKFKSLKTLFQT